MVGILCQSNSSISIQDEIVYEKFDLNTISSQRSSFVVVICICLLLSFDFLPYSKYRGQNINN